MTVFRNMVLLLILVLTSVSCAPKEIQVIQRHAPNALSQLTRKSKRVHVADSLLPQYLGRWESDQLIISFDSVVNVTFWEKQEVTGDVLIGRLWFVEGTTESIGYKITSSTVRDNILSLGSDTYRLNADLQFDLTKTNVLNWNKPGVLRERGIVFTTGNKDLYGHIILDRYKALPRIIPLTKVK